MSSLVPLAYERVNDEPLAQKMPTRIAHFYDPVHRGHQVNWPEHPKRPGLPPRRGYDHLIEQAAAIASSFLVVSYELPWEAFCRWDEPDEKVGARLSLQRLEAIEAGESRWLEGDELRALLVDNLGEDAVSEVWNQGTGTD